jgi:allantoinase
VLVVRSTRVVLPDSERPASIHIDRGVIVRIGEHGDTPSGADNRDAGDFVVSPGIVDCHVHVNEPGRTEWEGFDTATRAAAAGGVTTIVDMPLNSIPATTNVVALEAKRAAARASCHVDVGFWGGVVPGNSSDLDGLVDAGARGFKCFLVPSGVPEFGAVDENDLRRALPLLARRGTPLLVHAESPGRIDRIADWGLGIADCGTSSSSDSYARYLASRPASAELEAIEMMIRLAREYRARTHIVHVACAEGVEAIARAKAEGVPISGETCPHYLTFAAEEIPDGATEYKCAPPIRERRHREALWAGLRSGALDLVATDHSPAPPSMKPRGDFMRAWGGIASLELSLAATWTAFTSQDSRLSVESAEQRVVLARWMSDRPAALAGLGARKGRIAQGLDADLVIWDPGAERTVDPMSLQQRHKLTPYAGRRLRGLVKATFLRGERVWDDGALVPGTRGRFV